MKAVLILVFALTMYATQLVYAPPPEPDPESNFQYSDHVIIGKILSYKIFEDPRGDTPNTKYLDTIEYNVEVLEWLKNPQRENIITVNGTFYPNDVIPEPDWGIVAFKVGDIVYLYIDQTDEGLKFRSYGSSLLSNLTSECEKGEPPVQDLVFFDCKWVEIPNGWTFNNGKWQEDPSILKLGPEPIPSCPIENVCTCDGKYSYYNTTTQRCNSSPYIPKYYQKDCAEYRKLAFDGWKFDSKDCNWINLTNSSSTDKSNNEFSDEDICGEGAFLKDGVCIVENPSSVNDSEIFSFQFYLISLFGIIAILPIVGIIVFLKNKPFRKIVLPSLVFISILLLTAFFLGILPNAIA